jgi:hypothetical protein
MKGLTVPENDALTLLAGDAASCDGEHGELPYAPVSYETYVALKDRGLVYEYTCRAGCIHMGITALGRTAKYVADIVARGDKS